VDLTENARRGEVAEINSQVKSNDPESERARLKEKYGEVWDTKEMQEHFRVIGFLAPYVAVVRKSDGKKGSLEFQHHPRFYFNFH